jgi:hypothetical protein
VQDNLAEGGEVDVETRTEIAPEEDIKAMLDRAREDHRRGMDARKLST